MKADIKAWGPTRKIFRDPIHGFIALTSKEWGYLHDLVDSPEFQRLRRISQLGTTPYTYHGAEHSRFGHGLGTMWVVCSLIRRFREDKVPIEDDMIRNALTAALLHDIGHGPLSHVFEHLTNRKFSHEEMTREIIKKTPLKDRISDPEGVLDILVGLVPAEYRWMSELLSGPLDADKMDYLARDSYYTGTDYGKYDFERLFQSLIVYERESARHLGVLEKGLAPAEALVLARYRMYWAVYYHPKTRGVEKLILAVFNRVRDMLEEGRDVQLHETFQKVLSGERIRPEDMVDFDDVTLGYHLKQWKKSRDSILKDLCTRYFNHDLFKARPVPADQIGQYWDQRNKKIAMALKSLKLDYRYHFMIDDPSMLPYAPGDPEQSGQIWMLSTEKRGETRYRRQEIGAYSRPIRVLRDERVTEHRIHSTREGLDAVAALFNP